MEIKIFNNSLFSLLIVLAGILFVLATRRILSKYLASRIFKIISKKWTSLEKEVFFDLIINPLGWFITAILSVLFLDNLALPEFFKFNIIGISLAEILHRVGAAFIILVFIWVLQSFINFFAQLIEREVKHGQEQRDHQIIVFFRDFFKVFVYIIGFLILIKIVFKVNVGSLFTGLSIVGAAMALAAKESIENLIASFVIFFDKPFFTGDLVKVNTIFGSVEHIGLRSTRIRTQDKTLVTVPNKQMVDSVVDNHTKRSGRNTEIKIELHNSNSIEKLESLKGIILNYFSQKNFEVIKYQVNYIGFNQNGTTLLVDYTTVHASIEEYFKTKESVVFFLKKQLIDLEIQLAPITQQ